MSQVQAQEQATAIQSESKSETYLRAINFRLRPSDMSELKRTANQHQRSIANEVAHIILTHLNDPASWSNGRDYLDHRFKEFR